MYFKMLVVFCVCAWSLGDQRSHRVKRRLVFTKSSKMFFRLNGKDNVLPWIQIFAHGWGFRVNWELPESIPKRKKFFKRDIHDEIENISLLWGQQGYSCVMKYICERTTAIKTSKTCGMLCEIGNIISRSNGTDAIFFRSFTKRCDVYEEKCPYSLRKLSPHVDY